MAYMPTTYDDLIGGINAYDASYNTDPAPGETAQQHVTRLAICIATHLSEEAWSKLPDHVLDWHEQAMDARKAGIDLPEPVGYPPPAPPARVRQRPVVDDAPAQSAEPARRRPIFEEDKKEPTTWDHMRAAIVAADPSEPVDRAPQETPDNHIKRVARFLTRRLSNEAYDKLHESVQDWVQAMADQSHKDPAAAFALPAGYPMPAGASTPPASTPEAPARTRTRAGAEDPPAATNGAAPPAPAATGGRRGRQPAGEGTTVADQVIAWVVDNHTIADLETMKTAMAAEGSAIKDVTKGTRDLLAANALRLIKMAKSKGLWTS